MTGFRPQSKLINLTFEQPEYAGLEVKAKSLSIGKFLELSELKVEGTSAQMKERIEYIFEFFASKLISWNVQYENDNGEWEGVPATKEGLYTQDLDFVLGIISAWLNGIAAVSAPKEISSNTGENLKLLSEIPTETL